VHASVVTDVRRIRTHPLVPPTIQIYGYLYDVKTGILLEIPVATEIGAAAGTVWQNTELSYDARPKAQHCIPLVVNVTRSRSRPGLTFNVAILFIHELRVPGARRNQAIHLLEAVLRRSKPGSLAPEYPTAIGFLTRG